MPDIVYTWDAAGTVDYVNPRWAEYSGDLAIGDAEVARRIPADDLALLQMQREEALRQGTPLSAEFRLRDRLGQLRWFLTRCLPVRNSSGAITGWVGSSIDIDDQKRATQSLELSEARYRSVSEAFDFGIWSADAGGRLTFASPRLLQFLGMTLAEAQALTWHELLAPHDDAHRASALWHDCLTTGEAWESESSLVGADGTARRVWSRGLPLRSSDGGPISWAGLSLDVTERYVAKAARDRARERLKVVTDLMSVGVAQCNRQLEYVWVNPAYARYLGLAPEELQGRRIEEVIGSEAFQALEPYFKRVLAGESVQHERSECLNGGPERWIDSTYTPVWNGRKEPVGWVAVVTDLSDRRALENQLRDANRQKDQFLATLAHELRNPLAPIRYATRLLKPGVPPEMIADAGHMIDRQLGHMARLLDDLLDVSRITRGALELRQDILDLRVTLQQAVEAARPLAMAVEHQLQLEIPDEPLPIRGDDTRLTQVIGNLINNAIKYTDAGGRILISATARAGRSNSVSAITAEESPQSFCHMSLKCSPRGSAALELKPVWASAWRSRARSWNCMAAGSRPTARARTGGASSA